MKAILEFDLDDYHDQLAHKRVITATNVYLALFDIQNMLRTAQKYEHINGEKIENMSPEKVVEELHSEFYNILENYKIDMGNLE